MKPLAESINELDIKQIQAGDKEASKKFFDAIYPMIRHQAYSYARNRDDVEDIVQETWITIVESMPKYQSRSSFSTWCMAIAKNVARNYLRRQERLKPNLRGGEDASEVGVDKDTRRIHRLQEAMQKLGEKDRHILDLHMAGMTHKEIAESLEITMAASRQRYKRAIDKLSKIIEKIESEESAT